LSNFERAWIRVEWNGINFRQWLNRHVFELISDNRTICHEPGKRIDIVIGGIGESIADAGGNAVRFRCIDVGSVAQLGSSYRDHPAQLATPKDADCFAGGDHQRDVICSGWPVGDVRRLLGPECLEPLCQCIIAGGQNRRCQQSGILCTGFANRQGSNRHACRHLDDG